MLHDDDDKDDDNDAPNIYIAMIFAETLKFEFTLSVCDCGGDGDCIYRVWMCSVIKFIRGLKP